MRRVRMGVVLATTVLALGACDDAGSDGGAADVVSDARVDDTTGGDTGPGDTDVGDLGEVTRGECEGDTPQCAPGCGGDVLLGPAICVEGEWACEEGVLVPECPPGTCWGLPLPGEVCSNGWSCQPEDFAYEMCPETMCLTCRDFEGPVAKEGCTCHCDEDLGHVVCEPAEPECEVTVESDLDGVTLEVPGDQCAFTTAQAQAGVTFTWDVVVAAHAAEDGLEVVTFPQDAGHCDTDGPSGMKWFEVIEGGDEKWCICDEGLCQGGPYDPVTLEPGTFTESFEWTGRNFSGPSDTGFEPGAPFPPGTYEVTVSTVGDKVVEGGDDEPFEVQASWEITLTE
ncbi:MAG: hypothetical protein ACQEXJ_09780 [Myxococcota bacterium]